MKGVFANKMKGIPEWARVVAHARYNGWLNNLAMKFTGEVEKWVSAVYTLVEGSLDPHNRVCWQTKNWIANPTAV